ncbi:MAG: DUF1893 domain-containing protein [Anaeroplasmataceae bacterium]|nr:DUF1893 domain-containing protein [Anaeroplasmataceae bacterium]MDE6415301.1 DUF1893 domain-containing protein [Anaeroplasmataceae bacterium]
MTSLECAKKKLEGNTVCLVKGESLFISQKRGVMPLIEFIESNVDFKDYSVADKIVGKAAAFLYAYLGVKEVYAEVLSKEAIPVFKKYNISFEYNILTDYIINRKGIGLCPMEEAVMNCSSKEEAIFAIYNRYKTLQN